jgi:hypothetical protein
VEHHDNIYAETEKIDNEDKEKGDENNEECTDIDAETDRHEDEDEVKDTRVQVDNVRDSRVEDAFNLLLQTNSDQNQDLPMNGTENTSERASVQEDPPRTEENEEQKFPTTRSGRTSRPPETLMFTQAHHAWKEYSIENARVISMVMYRANDIILI